MKRCLLLVLLFLASCGMPAPYFAPLGGVPSQRRGIGVTGGGACRHYTCKDLENLGVSWAFSWNEYIKKDCEGIEPVCMVSCLAVLDRLEKKGLPAGCSDWLLTFNEPELLVQAAMSPSEAAAAWRRIEQLFPDKKLVAPAVVRIYRPGCWWGSGSCYWLDDWYNAYVTMFDEPPRIDALGGHCYGYYGQDLLAECMQVVGYLEDRLDAWGVDGGIWINEFGPNMWQDRESMLFELKSTMLYLEGNHNVARYAVWTMRTVDWALMNCFDCQDETLTDYGEIYKNLRLYELYLPFGAK